MNVTYGRQNTQIGQVQEFQIQLDESLIFRFLDNAIIIQDENQEPQMKFIIDGGLLKYQLWDGVNYLPPQSITNPAVSSDDSTVLPHNPANTYLSIDGNGLRVFFNLIESLVYFNQELSVQMQTFSVDNQLGDFVLRIKTLLGQNFYIKDYDSGANILHIGSTFINTHNKQLKNLLNASDPQDAVTLAQLQSLVPNTIQVKLPDTQVHIRNSIGVDLVNVDNGRLQSSVVMQYDAQKSMTDGLFIPSWQNILDALIPYQQTSQKNQVNGYAGLDNLGRLSSATQRPETCRILNNMVETYGGTTATTDFITEGISNQYFRSQRVLDVLAGQKGTPNGVASLDSAGLVPSSQLPTLQVGTTYSGFNVDKTNPAQYPVLTPIVGDRYISTDLQIEEVLTALPYTFAGNWIQLTSGGVISVNTLTGAVSLNTDDIPEGVDQYFQSGITDYKANVANQANELVKLDGSSTISTQIIPNTLRLKNGSMQLVDNQTNQIDIQNAQTNGSVLNIQRTQVVASVPFVNNGVPISNANQFADKAYVDNQLAINQPTNIQSGNTSVTTTNTAVSTEVNNLQVRLDEESQTTLNTPVLYNTLVPVTADQQLATKKYVDDVLSAFIANSGVSKEYLQALSSTSINTNGRVTGWSINVQSQTSQRIALGLSDTFNVIAGVYRFYIGIKIKDFKDDGLMNVAVIIRDTSTLQEYMLFDFRTIIAASGGNQEFTITQPYLWKLDNNANIEVYAQIGETTYNIYGSYLLIEEVEKYGVELGRDRITDPTLATTVLTTNQYVDFNVNSVDYGKMQNSYLSLTPGIKVKYDPSTSISQATDLTTKQYVDQSVLNSVTAITDLGQMFQAVLLTNQTILLTGGNPVRFNTQVLNTSTTMSLDGSGKITFTHGFVYQVSYSLAVQFSATSGFAILSFKNFNTLDIVPGSKLYIVTQPSSNTQQTSITVYLDLRAEVSPQSYTLNIDSSLNLGTIYSQYTRITCEQKQIITSQIWDRIQSYSTDTRVRVFNEGIEHFIDGQSLETITNDSSNVQRQLNNANAQIIQKSTTDSNQISDVTINTNTSNVSERQSIIVADVNSEVSVVMTSIVTDSGSGNEKVALFGGINADNLKICSSNPLQSEIVIQAPSQLAPIPITCYTKAGYQSGIVVDQADQFASKQYVDDTIAASYPPISSLPAPITDVSFAGYKLTSLGDATLATDALNRQTGDSRYYLTSTVLNSITAPTNSLSLNSQRITSLANATQATDALNRQTGDGRYYLNTTVLNSITAPTSSLGLNSQKITNLANGTDPNDAVNFSQLSAVSQPSTVGQIIMYGSNTAPTNFLSCDGTSYSRTTYATLFAVIGTRFGAIDINSFNIPDFRGIFPRGWNDTNSNIYADPDRLTRTALYTGGAIGNNVGSYQADAYENHLHSVPSQTVATTTNGSHTHGLDTRNTSGGSGGVSYGSSSTQGNVFTDAAGNHAHSVVIPIQNTSNSTTGSSETRPNNLYVLFCIRYQ